MGLALSLCGIAASRNSASCGSSRFVSQDLEILLLSIFPPQLSFHRQIFMI